MKNDRISCLRKIYGIIKHSQVGIGLVFHCRFRSLAFSACGHLSHLYSSYFFGFLSCASIDPTYFVKFSSLLAFILR